MIDRLFDVEETQESSLVRIAYSSNSEEWYTPQEVIKSVREVLGQIDLDPASCPAANQVVQASRIYTKEDDGLSKPWLGTLYLNPPYGRLGADRQRGKTELWVQKLIQEYEDGNVQEAILLVNAYLYKQWFSALWAYHICFPTGRFSFWNADGKSGRSPHSSALVYFGHNVQKFVDVFSELGPVAKVIQPSAKQKQPTLWDIEEQ